MMPAAFFDVDNTLLNIKSMFSFQRFYLDDWRPRHGPSPEGWGSYAEFLRHFEAQAPAQDRSALNRFFYQGYAGHSQQGLTRAARAWFAQLIAQRASDLWIRPAVDLANTLRACGHTLVAVSGSSHEILAPVLDHLGFDACLATVLEVEGDRLTGHIVPPQMIGPGKAVALRAWAAQHSVVLSECVACGDHLSDLPMLTSVGRAWVVAGDAGLEQEASRRGWPILRPGTLKQDMEEKHV